MGLSGFLGRRPVQGEAFSPGVGGLHPALPLALLQTGVGTDRVVAVGTVVICPGAGGCSSSLCLPGQGPAWGRGVPSCSGDLCLRWQRPGEQLRQHLPGKQRAPVALAGRGRAAVQPLRAPAKGPQRGVAAGRASLSPPRCWPGPKMDREPEPQGPDMPSHPQEAGPGSPDTKMSRGRAAMEPPSLRAGEAGRSEARETQGKGRGSWRPHGPRAAPHTLRPLTGPRAVPRDVPCYVPLHVSAHLPRHAAWLMTQWRP